MKLAVSLCPPPSLGMLERIFVASSMALTATRAQRNAEVQVSCHKTLNLLKDFNPIPPMDALKQLCKDCKDNPMATLFPCLYWQHHHDV
jgi:hypothetical protein